MPRTIKLEKAIEVLEKRVESPFVRANPDTKAAMKLGISAMKRIKQIRDSGGDIGMPVLKGETPPERNLTGGGVRMYDPANDHGYGDGTDVG